MSNENLESKRWIIAGAAIVMQLCLGTVYAWSVFKLPLMKAHGWGETSVSGHHDDHHGRHRSVRGLRRDPRRQEGPPLRGHHRRHPLRLGRAARRLCRSGRQPVPALSRLRRHRRPRQRLRLRDAHRDADPLVPRQARPHHGACRHGLRRRRLLHGQDRPRDGHQHGCGADLLHLGRDLPDPGHGMPPSSTRTRPRAGPPRAGRPRRPPCRRPTPSPSTKPSRRPSGACSGACCS